MNKCNVVQLENFFSCLVENSKLLLSGMVWCGLVSITYFLDSIYQMMLQVRKSAKEFGVSSNTPIQQHFFTKFCPNGLKWEPLELYLSVKKL